MLPKMTLFNIGTKKTPLHCTVDTSYYYYFFSGGGGLATRCKIATRLKHLTRGSGALTLCLVTCYLK